MLTTPELVEIACPHCGEAFAVWERSDHEPIATAVCPRCGHSLAADHQVREEGAWQPAEADEELQ
jgi:ribosomal protein S27AE